MYKYEDIRNFYFENEIGKRIDCQKINGGLFLYSVTGLGYEENIEYERVGNTFVLNHKETVQNIITGELEFYDMTYDEYQNFSNFILKSKDIKLIYIPKTRDRIEYYRDIDICKIEKSEEDEYSILTCPIEIKCKSLWYKKTTAIYDMKAQTNEIRWDFKWDSKFVDYDTRKLKYINHGHIEAPILVEINGHVINPKISLYIEGELYQEVPFLIEIAENEKILYGTKENEFYINKQNIDGTLTNLFSLDYLDFYNDNVIRIPQNRSCEIRLTAQNGISKAKVEILTYYKIV